MSYGKLASLSIVSREYHMISSIASTNAEGRHFDLKKKYIHSATLMVRENRQSKAFVESIKSQVINWRYKESRLDERNYASDVMPIFSVQFE
jgi:hypothetical protein